MKLWPNSMGWTHYGAEIMPLARHREGSLLPVRIDGVSPGGDRYEIVGYRVARDGRCEDFVGCADRVTAFAMFADRAPRD